MYVTGFEAECKKQTLSPISASHPIVGQIIGLVYFDIFIIEKYVIISINITIILYNYKNKYIYLNYFTK